MNNFSFFKLFSIFLIFASLSVRAFAADITNMLSEVIITNYDDYTYNLNLVFQNDFSGKAFLRTLNGGQYSVFIPDSGKAVKNVKIKNKAKNMPKIKVKLDEKPYVKDGIETSYIQLDVKTDEDYSLNLVSQKAKEKSLFASGIKFLLIMLILAACPCFITAYRIFGGKRRKNTYTVFPEKFEYKKKKQYTGSKKTILTASPLNADNRLKPADKETFGCFNIAGNNKQKSNSDFKIQSSIKKTSVLTNNLTKSSVVTNPALQTLQDDASELAIPFADEILTEKEPQKNKDRNILTVLDLTPTKGFYLKEMEDGFYLFGFIGDKTFLFKKFKDLSRINLQARFYDQNSKSDIYIVKLDSYKAMIEITEYGMKELAVL